KPMMQEESQIQTGNTQINAGVNEEEHTLPPVTPKRTWITLDQSPNGMLFRIAGSEPELNAFGELYSDRYEVFIEGIWDIYLRKPKTHCVNGMKRYYRSSETVLVFPLLCLPEVNRVYNEDARTIAIEIR
ncbi:MAG: hypothetical protein J6I40_02595, partial [Mailhella sp.]|nr:hypothetical protein [Mailhella sp.]